MNTYQIRERDTGNVMINNFKAPEDDVNTIFQNMFANEDCVIYELQEDRFIDRTQYFLELGLEDDGLDDIDKIDNSEDDQIYSILLDLEGKIDKRVDIVAKNGQFIGNVKSVDDDSVSIFGSGTGFLGKSRRIIIRLDSIVAIGVE